MHDQLLNNFEHLVSVSNGIKLVKAVQFLVAAINTQDIFEILQSTTIVDMVLGFFLKYP